MDVLNDYQENYVKGWICVYRSIKNHWTWQDPNKLQWWLTILLDVNWKPGKQTVGNKVYNIERGQSGKSIETWSRELGCNRKTFKNFLEMLKADKMIQYKTIGRGKNSTTLLTVLNYDDYQKDREEENKETGHTQGHTKGNTYGHTNGSSSGHSSTGKADTLAATIEQGNNDNNDNDRWPEWLEFSEYCQFCCQTKEISYDHLEKKLKAKHASLLASGFTDIQGQPIKYWKPFIASYIDNQRQSLGDQPSIGAVSIQIKKGMSSEDIYKLSDKLRP